MSEKLIERLRALLEKATPGPWHVKAYYTQSGTPDELCRGMLCDDNDWPLGIVDEEVSPDEESLSPLLDLIVAMHEALPSLLAEIERRDGRIAELEAENSKLRNALSGAPIRYTHSRAETEGGVPKSSVNPPKRIQAVLAGEKGVERET